MIEHIGSLCSGYGGLDRALSALLRLPFGWHTWFQVDGYPTGIEAPEPVVCTPSASSSCPVHGRCSCRVEYHPYRIIPARACPLHGEAGTHFYSNGTRRQW